VVLEGGTIAGHVVVPFLTRDAEGFDVNSPYDWGLAEHMVRQRTARLCPISQPPCGG
jgi:N-acylneuraminate cytidylyltransferase